ncbi:MAG TPA: type II toxin-antitoxin system death-on-curing family toxin [Chloroflexota bacterium]|nr:type II toxin-antitoxin system death-on-curing family toxin [Chloroflexota bacterium]
MGRGEGRERRETRHDFLSGPTPGDFPEIVYVTAEEDVTLYGDLMDTQGANPTDYVRDRNLLESALARPRHAALYEGADVARQAATLLWGLVKNQPFIDGNKRVAHLIAFTFLDVNGYVLIATEDEQFDLMVSIAAEGLDVDVVEDWVRKHLINNLS